MYERCIVTKWMPNFAANMRRFMFLRWKSSVTLPTIHTSRRRLGIDFWLSLHFLMLVWVGFWFYISLVLSTMMDAGFANGIFCVETLEVWNDSSNGYLLFEVMSSFFTIIQTRSDFVLLWMLISGSWQFCRRFCFVAERTSEVSISDLSAFSCLILCTDNQVFTCLGQ